jgi:CRP/FNR family transcriptional regulator, dissimilatory nitrate respiration regulator
VKNYLGLLRQIELVKSINTNQLESLLQAKGNKVNAFEKNNIVHFVGEVCEKLEIILCGEVVVERIDESGNLMTIAEFFDGDILGGNLLFSKNPYYPMTVTARKSSIVLEISKDQLFDLFADSLDFLKSYLEYISDHSVILGDRIKHYVNRTIRECIVSYLGYESKRQDSNTIKLEITKKALAERIGVQRTSLSRELAKMRDEGLVEFDSDTIKLLFGSDRAK